MREPLDLVVICAMDEESAPFLKDLEGSKNLPLLGPNYAGPSSFSKGSFQGLETLVVTSGIGTTNAAVAVTAILGRFNPKAVIVAGTAGGLGRGIVAGDVVVSSRVIYHEANATGFGYAAGQLPRMPEDYRADNELLELATQAATEVGTTCWTGTVGSSNSFITAELAEPVRKVFPDLLAVDMETAAVAQTCWMFGVPWLSVRAVSDLCAPEGEAEFERHAPNAYSVSFKVVKALAESLHGTEQQVKGRALLSVSDKTGLVDLARDLNDMGIELVATSSTAKAISEAGVPVIEVSELTGFPEILGGRVKTLHPVVHGGILARQNDPQSMETLTEMGIQPFNLVVVNLYPFEETLKQLTSVPPKASFDDCIEMIDIGGPTLVRAAAKNHESVAVATDPRQYAGIIEALRSGGVSMDQRRDLATEAFQLVADYDIVIANWLSEDYEDNAEMADWYGASYRKSSDLRYGENPHQRAALYLPSGSGVSGAVGLGAGRILGGKPLSFNNLQDASAAATAAQSFEAAPAVAIIKHANPCGIAVGETVAEAYAKALACDPLSAFGGVVATNVELDEVAAEQIAKVFTEVVVAPGFTPEALEILQRKKNLRILEVPELMMPQLERRFVDGGLLVQEVDSPSEEDVQEKWELVAGAPASTSVISDLEVAWKAAQFTKSNAIVLVKDGGTVGVGMGQVNRLDSARLAVERANTLADGENRTEGSVAASDAFFPFPDGLQVLIDAGVSAVVAPGGSMRDQMVIDAANEAGLTLYFTKRRHFLH